MSRLGQVLLDGGVHEGTQLVPQDHVQLMRTTQVPTGREHPDNAVFGLHWWPCARDGAWRMDGSETLGRDDFLLLGFRRRHRP